MNKLNLPKVIQGGVYFPFFITVRVTRVCCQCCCICNRPLTLPAGPVVTGDGRQPSEFPVKANCRFSREHWVKREETPDRDLHPHLVSASGLSPDCGFFEFPYWWLSCDSDRLAFCHFHGRSTELCLQYTLSSSHLRIQWRKPLTCSHCPSSVLSYLHCSFRLLAQGANTPHRSLLCLLCSQ